MFKSSAGYYPNSKLSLEKTVKELLKGNPEPGVKPGLVISPHGGTNDCGKVLGRIYSALDLSEVNRVMIVGPPPVKTGSDLGFVDEGFETPFGQVDVDRNFTDSLRFSDVFEKRDDFIHLPFVEMQLIFLQRLLGSFEVVPITVKNSMNDSKWRKGAEELEEMVRPSDLVVSCTNLAVSDNDERVQELDSEIINCLRDKRFDDFRRKGEEYGLSGWRSVLTGIKISDNYSNTHVFGHITRTPDRVLREKTTGYAGICLN